MDLGLPLAGAVSGELALRFASPRLSLGGQEVSFTPLPWGGFGQAGTCPAVRVDGERSVSREALSAEELPELPPGTEPPRAATPELTFCWCFLKGTPRREARRKPDAPPRARFFWRNAWPVELRLGQGEVTGTKAMPCLGAQSLGVFEDEQCYVGADSSGSRGTAAPPEGRRNSGVRQITSARLWWSKRQHRSRSSSPVDPQHILVSERALNIPGRPRVVPQYL
ncbi:uncharacterized protein ACIBXB_013715 isoform 2-T18 [Morphnus guianensis]